MLSADMVKYYAQRAPEYERIYEFPERQADLQEVRSLIRKIFAGRNVLEVACGTGYWTEVLAEIASSVFATDINEEVLEIARAKPNLESNGKVQFAKRDAYELAELPTSNAALIAFWWSHIPKLRIASFLDGLHAKLQPGSTVVIVDNCYVPGSSTPIDRTDEFGNTYQLRNLQDGSTHEVLKNFPSEAELRAQLRSGRNVAYRHLTYYWIAQYDF
ncbi:MAG TPA: class I SAM-dependent methyltransferase [Verrucomicrobiae bacterium]